jgi:acylphosphatase
MIAKKVFFAGRVQGVGFRYGTKQLAMGFDVVGMVRNLGDGRVELCTMGEVDEVEAFLQEIRDESNLSHHILEYLEEEIPLSEMQDLKGFSITG